MSHNSKTIEYFYREFRSNNIDKIFNIIAPDFTYCVNGGEILTYAVLEERMRLAKQGAKFIGEDMSSEDDIHFNAEFEAQVPDGNGTKSAFGFVEATISRGLIQSLNVHYHTSEEDVLKFRELVKNNALTSA